MSKNLFKVRYMDTKNSINLTNYADTIIYEKTGRYGEQNINAIRFGGYPEQVEAMCNAIYGGGSIFVELDAGERIPLRGLQKRYARKVTHDEVYAEATLTAADDNMQADEKKKEGDKKDSEEPEQVIPNDCPPRNCYIYVEPGDKEALFSTIDSKISVPLIPEFQVSTSI